MGRWVSPRGAVFSVLLVFATLLVQGVVNPLRGVRADTASSALGASAVAPAASSTTIVQMVMNTNTDPVNVRAMPTTESAILVQIAAGDRATVVETNVPGAESGTTWIRVAYQGRTGYVRADLVSAPQAPVATVFPTATSLTIGSATAATPTATPATTTTTSVTVVVVVASPSPAPTPDASATGIIVPTTLLTVAITDLTAPVKAGTMATAKVNTTPDAMCTIDVQYLITDTKAAGLGDRAADGIGAVSWTWQVGAETTRGSWPVVVTCASGGQTALGRMYLDVT